MSQRTPISNTVSTEIAEPLIRTKLAIPQRRNQLVSRPRLFELLNESRTRALTLICAPAGYGKTTLFTDWIATLDNEVSSPVICWLSLDNGDNAPNRFLSYLIAACARVNAEINNEVGVLLRTIPPQPFQSILSVLINELLSQNRTIILVLDDYHFISNPLVHEELTFFLEHQPANVHLVMLTRSDPPILLARLRARAQLIELRAQDLQFTLEETALLVNQIMRLGLTDEDLSSLLERTEGWAAGLQMAALALISQPDRALFVKNFSGSNRYILDFLVEEVLSHQSEAIQNFLIQTAILDSLNGALCDAVIKDTAAYTYGSSQEVLDSLERANLFVISLDSEKRWYRYHHLFTDLLRTRLEQKYPGLASELHLRASAWYEQNQLIPQAIDQALAAKDYDLACRLIEIPIEQLIGKNSMLLLLEWIHQIPANIANVHPWLCIAQGWSALFTNEAGKIEPLLQAAEHNFSPEDSPDVRNALLGHIACLRAFLADVQGDVKRMIGFAHQALVTYRLANGIHRAFAKYMLGRAYFIQGLFPQAIETFQEAIEESVQTETPGFISPTLSILSRIYRIQGRWRDAQELLQEGQAHIERWNPKRVIVAGMVYACLADLLREANELVSAEEFAHHAVELCEGWVNPSSMCVCYTTLVKIYLAQKNFSAAEDALQHAEEVIRGHNPFADVISDLNTVRIRLWLMTGRDSKASQWFLEQTNRTIRDAAFSILKERDEITIARILITEGKFELALSSLERLEKATETGQRFGYLIEILNLQALVLQAKHNLSQALVVLQKSLSFAQLENYVRIYLDESEPMQELLQAYIQSPSRLSHTSYARKLLTAFTTSDQATRSDVRKTNLIEPLTSRELQVLQLLTEGYSNRQIAETLILSEGTIKFHVHHVLEKLQAHTRSEAIAKARKQSLL